MGTLKIKKGLLLIIVTFTKVSCHGWVFSRQAVTLSGDFACLSAATSAVTAHFSKIVTIT